MLLYCSSQKYQSCKLTNSALVVKYTTRSNRYRVPDFIIIYPYPGSLFHRNSVLCVAIISRERNRIRVIRLIFQPRSHPISRDTIPVDRR